MARLFLIIDGYNLMHAAGLGRKSYGPGDLERSRKRLLSLVQSRLEKTIAADTVVIFDATPATAPAPGDAPPEAAPPLTVVFSSEGRDADTEIEMLLGRHSSPRQVLVVSSDHRLHKAARRRKARCIDSEEFLNLQEPATLQSKKQSTHRKPVARPVASSSPSSSTGSSSSAGQAVDMDADYARDFLKIDVEEIQRSVRKESRR
jgi:predicted RNA-binding protein with PIN domain